MSQTLHLVFQQPSQCTITRESRSIIGQSSIVTSANQCRMERLTPSTQWTRLMTLTSRTWMWQPRATPRIIRIADFCSESGFQKFRQLFNLSQSFIRITMQIGAMGFWGFGELFLMSMELVQPEITRVTMPISLNVLKFTTMKPQVCAYEIEY